MAFIKVLEKMVSDINFLDYCSAGLCILFENGKISIWIS